MTDFGALLKRARIAAGLSVLEAARAAGTSHSYWYEMERGEKSPTIDKLADLARAVRVHPSYLLPDHSHEKTSENNSAVAV